MPLGPRPQFKIIGYPFLVALLLDLYSLIPEQLVCRLPFQVSIPNLFDRDLNMVKQNLKKCVTFYQQLTPHCKVVQQHSIFKVKCGSCLNNFAQNTRTWLHWQKSSTFKQPYTWLCVKHFRSLKLLPLYKQIHINKLCASNLFLQCLN